MTSSTVRATCVSLATAAATLATAADLPAHETTFHERLTAMTIATMAARHPWLEEQKGVVMYGSAQAPDREKGWLDNREHKHAPGLVSGNLANGVAAYRRLAAEGRCREAEREGARIMSKALHYISDQSELVLFVFMRYNPRIRDLDGTYPLAFEQIMGGTARQVGRGVIGSMGTDEAEIRRLMGTWAGFDPGDDASVKRAVDALQAQHEARMREVVDGWLPRRGDTGRARARLTEIYRDYIRGVVALQNLVIENYDAQVGRLREGCVSAAAAATVPTPRPPAPPGRSVAPPPARQCPPGQVPRTRWFSSDGRHATCCPNGVPNPRCLGVKCTPGEVCVPAGAPSP